MINEVLVSYCPATADASVELGFEDEKHPVVDVLHGLDELDGKAGIDEISDGAVDASSIRTNVDNLLRKPVRNPGLVIKTGRTPSRNPPTADPTSSTRWSRPTADCARVS